MRVDCYKYDISNDYGRVILRDRATDLYIWWIDKHGDKKHYCDMDTGWAIATDQFECEHCNIQLSPFWQLALKLEVETNE